MIFESDSTHESELNAAIHQPIVDWNAERRARLALKREAKRVRGELAAAVGGGNDELRGAAKGGAGLCVDFQRCGAAVTAAGVAQRTVGDARVDCPLAAALLCVRQIACIEKNGP